MTTSASAPVVRVEGLGKTFPGVRALDGVSLALLPGEVHGIVGENGAGKSTLMKLLCGVHRPTAGRILVDDRAVQLNHPIDARRLGIAMIHQELNLVDELSVADNIFLGRERTTFGLVHRRSMIRQARQLLAEFQTGIDPAAKVKSLSVAQMQMVEIAKAVSTDARVVIMDEPTAVLTQRETRVLFEIIARLKRRGVTIVYVSHILPDVLKVCDRVTVMRDGRVVTTLDPARVRATTEQQLAGLMVGRPMQEHFPKRRQPGDAVLMEVQGLSVPGKVEDATFTLRRGEILGFAGLIGAGRTELGEAIVGLRDKSRGAVLVNGLVTPIGSPRDAVRAGIAYLSEDRKAAGLTLPMSVVANTTLVSLRRYSRLLLRTGKEADATREHVRRLRIKAGSIHDPVASLSGGNQQKVLLAKWLETNPQVLIVDEPTRGVDIGAKEEIYRLIQQLTTGGMACMMISSEMNELLGMCHRIAVMRRGRIVATLNGPEATEEQIMYHAAGVAGSHAPPVARPH